MEHLPEPASTDEYGAYGIYEIVHGVYVGGQVGPVGHGAGRGEQAAQQHDAHHKEPHHKDGLLHGIAVVGHQEAEAGEEQGQEHG